MLAVAAGQKYGWTEFKFLEETHGYTVGYIVETDFFSKIRFFKIPRATPGTLASLLCR